VGKTHERTNSTDSSVSSVVSAPSRTNDNYHGTNFTPHIQDGHDYSPAANVESEKLASNNLSPDIRMASELFNNSAASNAFADIVPNHDNEIQRLTERIRDLEYKERMNEASLSTLNTEYQKAVSKLKHIDPVVRWSRKHSKSSRAATYLCCYRLADRKHTKATRRGASH
jgi:hypothetical protein